jgi:hypothetical protein
MGMKRFFSLGATVTLLLFWTTMANSTPVKDKVAVLILSWGAPAGACLDYAWQSHQTCRIGDRTLYPGQPCKFGHVGEFPYQIHIGILPWALTCLWVLHEEGSTSRTGSSLWSVPNHVQPGRNDKASVQQGRSCT